MTLALYEVIIFFRFHWRRWRCGKRDYLYLPTCCMSMIYISVIVHYSVLVHDFLQQVLIYKDIVLKHFFLMVGNWLSRAKRAKYLSNNLDQSALYVFSHNIRTINSISWKFVKWPVALSKFAGKNMSSNGFRVVKIYGVQEAHQTKRLQQNLVHKFQIIFCL